MYMFSEQHKITVLAFNELVVDLSCWFLSCSCAPPNYMYMILCNIRFNKNNVTIPTLGLLLRCYLCVSIPSPDSSLTHNNLAAVLETVKVWQLGNCLSVPLSVRGKLRQQCDNEEKRRNELISWWLQSSPYALDSWKWLSGQLLFYYGKESALAATKSYVHRTPGTHILAHRTAIKYMV